MSFISLSTGKFYKKRETRKLKNLPAGYVGRFYRNLADNVDNFLGLDFCEQITKDYNIPSEDVQKYILATSNFTKGIQTDINHYVTKDRINNASFRQKLDPISKNILRRQNPLELVFEDISTFDVENPIVSSLLKELDVSKKDLASEFIKKALRPPDLDYRLRNWLENLKDRKDPFDNDNNNNLSPPPSPLLPSSFFVPPPPPQPPQPPLQPPPPSTFWIPPLLPPPPSFQTPFFQQQPLFNFSQPSGPGNSIFGSQAQELVREEKPKGRVLKEIDEKILELPDPPKIVLGDVLAHMLGTEAENILEDKYLNSKELEDKTFESIKEEYNFDEIRDAFDEAAAPNSIQFFYRGDNDEFI